MQDAELIAACMDAQRREVFSALYARSAMEKDRREQARGSATHAEFAELAEHAEHGKHVDVEETAAGLDVIEPPIVGGEPRRCWALGLVIFVVARSVSWVTERSCAGRC